MRCYGARASVLRCSCIGSRWLLLITMVIVHWCSCIRALVLVHSCIGKRFSLGRRRLSHLFFMEEGTWKLMEKSLYHNSDPTTGLDCTNSGNNGMRWVVYTVAYYMCDFRKRALSFTSFPGRTSVLSLIILQTCPPWKSRTVVFCWDFYPSGIMTMASLN